MRLLIIRHGEPDYAHDDLTPKGRREAELLARRLCREGLTHVYCSPLGRAAATARPTLAKTGLRSVTLDWLREFPLPLATEAEPEGTCPWELPVAYWQRFPGIDRPDGWQSASLFQGSGIPQAYEAITQAFDALMEDHGFRRRGRGYEHLPGFEGEEPKVALFCHLGLGNLLLAHIAGVSLPVWWHHVFLPTSSVTTARMERRGSPEDGLLLRLIGIGDVGHLYAAGEPVSDSGLLPYCTGHS